jgi:hypothetical protein
MTMKEVVGEIKNNPCSHYDPKGVRMLEVVTEIPGQKEGGLHCRLCDGTWTWRIVAGELHVHKV